VRTRLSKALGAVPGRASCTAIRATHCSTTSITTLGFEAGFSRMLCVVNRNDCGIS